MLIHSILSFNIFLWKQNNLDIQSVTGWRWMNQSREYKTGFEAQQSSSTALVDQIFTIENELVSSKVSKCIKRFTWLFKSL